MVGVVERNDSNGMEDGMEDGMEKKGTERKTENSQNRFLVGVFHFCKRHFFCKWREKYKGTMTKVNS